MNFPAGLVEDGDHEAPLEGKMSVPKRRRKFLAVLDGFGISRKAHLEAVESVLDF